MNPFRLLFASSSDLHYCSHCHTLLNESQRENHRELGHDVDNHSEAYYEEIERSAGVLS